MVWPALLPPWNRTTMSARFDSQSMILPLPSSPHWAPITVTLAMNFRTQIAAQPARERARWPLIAVLSAGVRAKVPQPVDEASVEHPINHADNLARILVDQKRIIVDADPDRAERRGRQVVIGIIV